MSQRESATAVTLRIPKLGFHKARGQARVVIEGRSFYLGKPGPEATQRYGALVAEYLKSGQAPATVREVVPRSYCSC